MNTTAATLGDDYILSDADLKRITCVEHWDAQCAALRRMGIRFQPNDKGRPVVTRDAVRAYTGERSSNDGDTPSLNLRALDGAQAKRR